VPVILNTVTSGEDDESFSIVVFGGMATPGEHGDATPQGEPVWSGR
jgi:hypothetical protein